MARLTPNQKAYLEERARIGDLMYELAQRGRDVDYTIPEPPRRITKKFLNTLKSIDFEYLSNMSYPTTQDDFYSLTVISNYRAMLDTAPGSEIKQYLGSMLDKMLGSFGVEGTANILLEAQARGIELTYAVMYNIEVMSQYIAAIERVANEYGVEPDFDLSEAVDFEWNDI